MYLCGLDKAKLYMTAYLLWLAGCVSKKVYFECGARLDVSNTQGLILSPGFPHNYSSHTHCVWQFVVPAGHLLTMEMLDFDVFESHGDAAGSPTASAAVSVESLGDGVEDLSPFMDELISTGGRGRAVKEPGPARGAELKRGAELTQLVFQEESGRVHVAAGPPSPVTPTTAVEWDEDTSTETQLSGVDVCPHDVLYISDLLTFSSRFCGSNHPASGQLEFGSDAEMVEVVLELITTTHWGRGFALLFYYRNWTQALAAGQSSLAPSDGTVATLVAAVCGAALFSMAMGCTLWVIFRPKLCAKGSNTTPSIESEVLERGRGMGRGRGRSSLSAEGSELQLVAPSHPGKQLTTPENDRHLSLPLTDPAVRTNVSQNAELECSSALTEMEMDEVFAISTRTCTAREAFLSHAQHERFLQHSDTEASQLWTAPTSPGVSTVTEGVHVGSVSSARPRAWRVRTFEDFLSPLPPLQKRWGNWMTSRPFTKLGTSGSAFSPAKPHNDTRGRDLSDTMLLDQLNDTRGEDLFDGMLLDQLNGCNSKSSGSSTPYSPVQQAQRQQRVNLVGGLWRLCFTGSDFGPLSSASESSTPPGGANRNATTACHQHPEPNSTTSGQQEMQEQVESGNCSAEDDHLQVPMFAILEEDDRQPLVLAEHGARPSMGNNKGYESPKKSRALAETPVRLTKEPLGHFEKHVM